LFIVHSYAYSVWYKLCHYHLHFGHTNVGMGLTEDW